MIGPEILALLIPIIALMIPIVAVLTKHQQRMTELMHQNAQPNEDVRALRAEIAELKRLVQDQTLALDDLNRRTLAERSPTVPEQELRR